MNEALNGIPLAKSVHVEGMVHSVYNQKIEDELVDIVNKKGANISPQVAEEELIKLINKIKLWINNNPNVNLNNITFQ